MLCCSWRVCPKDDIPSLLLLAYEDKQKQKRSEIIDRPWFSPAQVSNIKASDTLKKLALTGKSPAGKSPAALSNLGVVRRKSRDKEQTCAEECESSSPPGQADSQPQDSALNRVSCDSPVVAEMDSPKAEGSPPSNLAASLVADYSDSASDPEAEL